MIQWKQILQDSLDAVEVICVEDVYSQHSKVSCLWKLNQYTCFAPSQYPGHPLVLAGRSFGARMCCLVAGEVDVEASAVICFGYLVEGMTGAAQDETLSRLEVPVIFIQGSRDVFCPLEKLEVLRKKMKCYNELHVVDGGNHSFSVGEKHLLENGLTEDVFKCLRVATSVFPVKNQNKDAKDGSLSPVVVLAPGSTTPVFSDWMIRWKAMLKNALDAVEVITFDYLYMSGEKKRAPPKAGKLVKFHKNIVKQPIEKCPGHPLILAGKAVGARVSCMVASEVDVTASAVICLGYPLKSIIRARNDETLLELRVPAMFVQGSNDVFCPFDMLEALERS